MNQPDAVQEQQTVVLEKIVQEFPYFQSARALYLKGLYNQNSFKYNYALKITAAHTTDRSVLFDFITSDSFTSIQKNAEQNDVAAPQEIRVAESEFVVDSPRLELRENTLEQSIAASIKEAAPAVEKAATEEDPIGAEPTAGIDTSFEDAFPEFVAVDEQIIESVENTETEQATPDNITEKLEIGKPLDFQHDEKHSFQEWLQLSKLKPIVRDEENTETELPSEVNFEKQKKNELIDKFIETSPKIPQLKHDMPLPAAFYEPSKADNSFLMTETLARVYLEQKKYQKAIQAYEILILKYPEKSSFFADRILDIKNLQQNNT